ncbi:MAG TPA: protein-methionine-sulfoxide reductase heme-binding subunit MsrQ [Rhizobiaceae bacterium]|nr:protein-methionine-sulfoxide reductase heme-binding subunit MsrQ [Rhizobiaceae bacterium]
MPWTDRAGRFSPLKAAVFAGILVPALMIAWSWEARLLGPRPITEAIHQTGDWTIRFLLLSLAVTPLRRIGNWPKLIQVRRMLGLAALAYGLAHLTLYMADQKWNLWRVGSEIALRVYLTIGFSALVGLVALGATSTDAMIRRLGGNWNRLHRIVYAIGILGAVHFFMQTKADVYQATLMSGLFILLMLYRIAHWRGLGITSLPVLAGIAALAGLGTAAAECAWYGLATGVPPMRVLLANLDFAFQVRPSWWVVAVGLGAAALAFVRSHEREKRPVRGRPMRNPA